MRRSLLTAALIVLNGCGGSPHAPEERYFLVASNIKVPYWQEAGAGLRKAAMQLQVKAEMIVPDTFDPKQQQAELQRGVKLKPTGIMVSGRPKLLKDDIDAAIAAGTGDYGLDALTSNVSCSLAQQLSGGHDGRPHTHAKCTERQCGCVHVGSGEFGGAGEGLPRRVRGQPADQGCLSRRYAR